MAPEQAPLSRDEALDLADDVPEWSLQESKLQTHCQFADFEEAMDFINQVAELASEADHHPDMLISYNKVRLELTTHKLGGLTRKDFVLAARISRLSGGKCRGAD